MTTTTPIPALADLDKLTRYAPNGMHFEPQPHATGGFYKVEDVQALARRAAQPVAPVQLMPLSAGLPTPEDHERVLVYTDGVDFNTDQYFEINTEDLWEPDPDLRTEVADAATHWMPLPRPGVATPSPQIAEVAELPTARRLMDIADEFGSGSMAYTVDDMRDAIAASRRAAGGEPVATVFKKGAERQWVSETLGALPDGVYRLYLATPAPASAGQAVSAQRIREIGAGVYGFPIKSDDMQFAQEVLAAAAQPAEGAGQSELDAELRREVSMMYQLLDDGEWAEHIAKTPHGQCLETAITKLVAKAGGAGQAGQVADEWHDAVFAECMKIETAYKADDPAGTVRALIHWYYEEASGVSDGVKRLADNYMRLTCGTERAAAPAEQPSAQKGGA